MRVHVGTSGWQYKDWRGRFYPADLPTSAWLEHYAAEFACVEVNNTFYRLPEADVFAAWARRTPDDFVLVTKASRYLTHVKRLMEPEEPVERFLERASALGPKLGPVLVQLPPTLRAEPERLDRVLECFDGRARVVVEPRHETWFTAEVEAVLAAHGAALCLTDRLNRRGPVRHTAPWAYLRLHEGRARPWPRYGDAALSWWVETLADAPSSVEEAWVFFNNDPGCWAVANARTFARLAERRGLEVTRFPERPPRVARVA